MLSGSSLMEIPLFFSGANISTFNYTLSSFLISQTHYLTYLIEDLDRK